MLLDEGREAELDELVARLDRLLPREGAHLVISTRAGAHATVGNRLGYLRLGVEMLKAARRPLPGSDDVAPSIAPQLDYLLPPDRETPFDFCEIDESITARPPIASRLGPLGQLATALLVVGIGIVLLVLAGLLWRWTLG